MGGKLERKKKGAQGKAQGCEACGEVRKEMGSSCQAQRRCKNVCGVQTEGGALQSLREGRNMANPEGE